MKPNLLVSVVLVGVLGLLIGGAAMVDIGPNAGEADVDTSDLEATTVTETATDDDFELAVEIEPAETGGQVTIDVSLINHGDDRYGTAIDATVPDDWRVVDHDDDGGTFREPSVDWIWLEHGAGATYEPAVTVELPGDSAGEHALTFTASDPDGNDVTVDVTVPVEASD